MKSKEIITKRRIVSDNESDSLNSIPRGGGVSVASSGAHGAPSHQHMRAGRSCSATRGSSSELIDGGSSQRRYPKDTAKTSTSSGKFEQPKREPKVGPPRPSAKRSPAKIGPPIGKSRAAPPKAPYKVGPPIGKSKSVAPTGAAPMQPQEGRSGIVTEAKPHRPVSTRSHHSGDEDTDDDSLCM
jgi:hypothetical protein